MNISEVEKQTGVTKQNVRFYEKEGLVFPKRNGENSYREYDERDVRRLKLIYLLRRTGISIPEVKKVLDGELELSKAVSAQREKIAHERDRQNVLIEICDDLKLQSAEWIDVDYYRAKMEQAEKKEKRCSAFGIWKEFRQVFKAEERKKFVFMPDAFIETPEDFTQILIQYAENMHADMIITKEGMYPEFLLNGIAYRAARCRGWLSEVVRCEMIHPLRVEPDGIRGTKKKYFQAAARLLPGIVIFFFWAVLFLMDVSLFPIRIIMGIFGIVFGALLLYSYCHGHD